VTLTSPEPEPVGFSSPLALPDTPVFAVTAVPVPSQTTRGTRRFHGAGRRPASRVALPNAPFREDLTVSDALRSRQVNGTQTLSKVCKSPVTEATFVQYCRTKGAEPPPLTCRRNRQALLSDISAPTKVGDGKTAEHQRRMRDSSGHDRGFSQLPDPLRVLIANRSVTIAEWGYVSSASAGWMCEA
jgi:hypothetical protein